MNETWNADSKKNRVGRNLILKTLQCKLLAGDKWWNQNLCKYKLYISYKILPPWRECYSWIATHSWIPICVEEWLHPAIKIDLARSNSARAKLKHSSPSYPLVRKGRWTFFFESREFLELQESSWIPYKETLKHSKHIKLICIKYVCGWKKLKVSTPTCAFQDSCPPVFDLVVSLAPRPGTDRLEEAGKKTSKKSSQRFAHRFKNIQNKLHWSCVIDISETLMLLQSKNLGTWKTTFGKGSHLEDLYWGPCWIHNSLIFIVFKVILQKAKRKTHPTKSFTPEGRWRWQCCRA